MSSKKIGKPVLAAFVTVSGIVLSALSVPAQTPAPRTTPAATKAVTTGKATTGGPKSADGLAVRFTGTTVNVVGAHDAIRIDLMQWSNDADRDRTIAAWTQALARAAAVAGTRRTGATQESSEEGDKVKVVIPGDGRRSPLIAKLSDQTGKQMPPKGPLPDSDIAIVFGWIERGAKPADFAKDVQPIFNKNCVSCHSGSNPKAGLHLDTLEGVLEGGDDLAAAASARLAASASEAGSAASTSSLTPEGSLVTALEKAPTLGYVWSSSQVSGYAVHYAVRLPEKDGSENVILITDRRLGDQNDSWQPLASAEAKKDKEAANYEFSVIELHLGAKGSGEGKISLDNKLVVDNAAKTIRLADYKDLPVVLKNVDRRDTR